MKRLVLITILAAVCLAVPALAEEWSLRVGNDIVRPGDSLSAVMRKMGAGEHVLGGCNYILPRETRFYNEGKNGFMYRLDFELGVLKNIERLDERGY